MKLKSVVAISITFITSLLFAFTGQAASKPASFEVLVSLLQRDNAQTPEKDYQYAMGSLKLTYQTENTDDEVFSVERVKAVKNSIKIPIRIQVDGQLLKLKGLWVLDANGREVVSFDQKRIEGLKQSARFGATLVVLLTNDGKIAPTSSVIPNLTPAPDEKPETVFRPLTDAFPDPTQILNTPDLVDAALKLRAIASATPEYHAALVSLLESAKAVDVAHLNLLMTAVYYSWADVEQMEEASRKGLGHHDQLTENISLAYVLSSSISRMLSIGLAKTTDLSLESSFSFLNNLFPTGVVSEAFNAVISRFKPMDAQTKLKLRTLALEKAQTDVGINLSLDWFKNDSDRSPSTLISLAKDLMYGTKDTLIDRGMRSMPTFSTEQLIALSQAAYSDRSAILLNNISKISDLNPNNAIKIVENLSFSNKDSFLWSFINRSTSLTTAELALLSEAAYSDRSSMILNNTNRLSDWNVKNTLQLAELLLFGNKDSLIQAYLAQTGGLSTSDLIMLKNAAYSAGSSILLNNMRKLNDLNVSNALKIIDELLFGNKDAAIVTYFSLKPGSLTAAELISFSAAAYSTGSPLIIDQLGKVSDLTVDNAIKLVEKLSFGNKDTFLLKAVDMVTNLTASNLKDLASHAYTHEKDVLQSGKDRLNN